ncbi:hypothetical protein acsn021_30410 [Anaerocolumna cellulosilytica]|uniref:Uncharacterized protein n=1 Tax=Anaerocolumna cellulosilytica TaxID=433286 RepID=A0A6S6R7Z9_9FIRM|nr:hypothetical protein [Anaerocolumna cellulosilytica]MBB5197452.1 hypothetical protein [Anaerocolumna cellulosilytica]BCJ95472.1 hypothetical protein acsn021_30410 [Anaerocolumna cellulosilytica]
MLGFVYLAVSILTGCTICTIMLPGFKDLSKQSYNGKLLSLPSCFVLFPAWYLSGTLSVTWFVYLTAYLLREQKDSLLTANILVMTVLLLLQVVYWFTAYRKKKNTMDNEKSTKQYNFINFIMTEAAGQRKGMTNGELLFFVLALLLTMILMWSTFFIRGTNIYVGNSVYSDFAPHIGMIRSFSKGNNFPTVYSHFAGEDIRYHFMFQFMAGNLEKLGMRLDYAFNVPSILSLLSVYMLLFIVAVKITGKRTAGYLAALFFTFRSSKSLFLYLSEIPKDSNPLEVLLRNTEFIGYTPNENWGLWNLNVYCNQRHLAFSLGILLLLLLLFLPLLYERWLNSSFSIKGFLLRKEDWEVKDLKTAIFGGVLLGSIAFWNGAVLIAALAVLFVIGISAVRRMELVVLAVIAGILTLMQSNFFIEGSSISPTFYFGFLAENKTLFGTAAYLDNLLGILPFVLAGAFLAVKSFQKYLMAAFAAPILLALTLSLTPDIAVNHKYIMIGVMLLGIPAANFLAELYQRKGLWVKIFAVLAVLTMTFTGIYDFYTLLNKNGPAKSVVLDTDSSLTKWIEENTNTEDVFLTSNYALNQIVLGGAMLYQGWQYYAWSAGYDTAARDEQVRLMYEASTSEELVNLVKINNIRYIVVDLDNRYSDAYVINEENISNTFTCVYEEGMGNQNISIYDTTRRLGNKTD